MIRYRHIAAFAAAALAAFLFAPGASAQEKKIVTVAAPQTDASSGVQMYGAYCAVCHGLQGKGDGPAASALKQPLPDLTQLTRRHNGEFPTLELSVMIQGDSTIAAHGSKNMPMWGDVFRSFQDRESIVKLRVHNLVEYIRSMQTK